MKVIIEQAAIFKNVVGQQKFNLDQKYRLLHYCVIVPYDNDFLCYNNLTKELILLDKQEMTALYTDYIKYNSELVKTLIKKWFFVPLGHDDAKFSKEIAQLAKSFYTSTEITFYNILTTTACNARCHYCFEAGATISTMTPHIAGTVAEYIISHCQGKNIKIQWFGGEPLCNINPINIISNSLKSAGIKFSATMITNGYLFNDENIADAKSIWQLDKVQITLDGLESTYKNVKNYVNAVDNPFERVIRNIEKLVGAEIFVDIRLNMDLYNATELHTLVDYIYERFGNNSFYSVYVCPVFENCGYKQITHSAKERDLIDEEYFKLYEHIEKLAIGRKTLLKNSIKTNCCMADNPNCVLISPMGELGCCEHYVDSRFYGTVFTNDNRQCWTEYEEPFDKCRICPLYPTCFRLVGCGRTDCRKFRSKGLLKFLEKSIVRTYEKHLNAKD